jgi:hypothetical protein
VGSHSITAVVTATDTYDTSTSSASTLTVLDHSYSLAFSQSSYPASSGSATLELTLLDNSVPVSGATVSITGSDSSSYSCITNSSGVGSVTVTDISAETTFTCSYQGVSDTCTVTTSSVIYQPALDGTESKYQLTGSTTIANGEMYGGSSYLTAGWDNTGNWELTCKFKPTGAGCGIVLILPNTTSRDKDNLLLQRGTSSMELFIHAGTSTTSEDRTTFSSFSSTNVWYDVTITKTSSTSLTVAVSYNNTTKTNNYSWSKLSSTTMCVGLDKWSTGNSYIKDIKVEAL